MGNKRSPPPPTELAALVAGCQQDRAALPALADWLDERLGLTATAALLRRPTRLTPPEEACYSDLQVFALAEDVSVWLVQVCPDPLLGDSTRPGTLLGLYAHPAGWHEAWARLTCFLPRTRRGVAAARKELLDFHARSQTAGL